MGALQEGVHALIEGEVLLAEIAFRRRRQLLVRLGDGTGTLTLRFFHFSPAQRAALERGTLLRCHGQVRRGPLGLELVHPEYRRIATIGEPLPQTLTPVYPASAGQTQGRLRLAAERALRALGRNAPVELLPQALLERLELPSLSEAL